MVLKGEYKGTELKFFELCTKVVEEQGLSLYDMDYQSSQKLLRLYVMDMATGSALIDDCIKVDKAMTPFVEEETWMPSELTLEVSSPGLYRQLNTIEHFNGVVGENVNLVIKKNVDASDAPKGLKGNKKFIAKLLGVSEQGLELEFKEYKFELNFEDIKKANLESDLDNV